MIELKNAGVAFDKTQVLFDINCVFGSGEFTCVIGKNGSGKSTMLRAMAGLIPYEGSVTLKGCEISEFSKKDRAKLISYLPQIRPVPAMDVRTLIAHGRYPHLGFSKTLAKKDTESIRNAALVADVEGLLERPLATLSGGERQRAYIAMTVAQDAEIMLLDEPAAYLDIECQHEIMELLTRLNKAGKGIVMVAHDLPQAFSCAKRVVLLSNGAVAACGTPDSLCESRALEDIFGVTLKRSAHADDFYSYRLVKGGR